MQKIDNARHRWATDRPGRTATAPTPGPSTPQERETSDETLLKLDATRKAVLSTTAAIRRRVSPQIRKDTLVYSSPIRRLGHAGRDAHPPGIGVRARGPIECPQRFN